VNNTEKTRPDTDPSSLGKAAESGMALVTTILIMALMSGLLIGFYAMVAADQQASGVNRDQTQAWRS
jgi:hypothetical protein